MGIFINIQGFGTDFFGIDQGLGTAQSGIIAQKRINPVLHVMVVPDYILGSRFGRWYNGHALINFFIHPQAHFDSGFLFKLPITDRIGCAYKVRNQTRFLNDQILKVIWKSFFLKNSLHNGQIGIGPVHHLPEIFIVGNKFAYISCKRGFCTFLDMQFHVGNFDAVWYLHLNLCGTGIRCQGECQG